MARPCRCRMIGKFPDYWMFSAEDHNEEAPSVLMTLDEYETIRLIDFESMTQEECAASMGISRPSVSAIYERARKKLSLMLIEGRSLRITGGVYQLSTGIKIINEKKGVNCMRIAVTYDNGEVFPHFGRTSEFKLYDVDNGTIVNEQILSSNGFGHGSLVGILKEAQVDLLICGGIGMGARMAFSEAGIALCPGVSGNTDEVVRALINSELDFDPNATCDHHDHDHGCGHNHREGQGGCCH